jgi:hypothetical protein
MANKEATARIKINKLLEAVGWRFFPEGMGRFRALPEKCRTLIPGYVKNYVSLNQFTA